MKLLKFCCAMEVPYPLQIIIKERHRFTSLHKMVNFDDFIKIELQTKKNELNLSDFKNLRRCQICKNTFGIRRNPSYQR